MAKLTGRRGIASNTWQNIGRQVDFIHNAILVKHVYIVTRHTIIYQKINVEIAWACDYLSEVR